MNQIIAIGESSKERWILKDDIRSPNNVTLLIGLKNISQIIQAPDLKIMYALHQKEMCVKGATFRKQDLNNKNEGDFIICEVFPDLKKGVLYHFFIWCKHYTKTFEHSTIIKI